MFYLLNRALKSQTILIIVVLASKSLKLGLMLTRLDELFFQRKTEKMKIEKPKTKKKWKLKKNLKNENRKHNYVFFTLFGKHNCVFHFILEAQLWFFYFSRSTIVPHAKAQL